MANSEGGKKGEREGRRREEHRYDLFAEGTNDEVGALGEVEDVAHVGSVHCSSKSWPQASQDP